MCSPRLKSLLLVGASCLTILFIIFNVRLSVNRSNDRPDERTSKAEAPPLILNSAPEPKEGRSHDLKNRLHIQPQRSLFTESLQEIPPIAEEKPQDAYLFWDRVQEDLALIIRDKFSEWRLSQKDLQALTETIQTLQKSMLTLRGLERTRDHREQIEQMTKEVGRALERFEEITQMSISDFILYGRPESGLDNGKPDDDEIVEVYLDPPKS